MAKFKIPEQYVKMNVRLNYYKILTKFTTKRARNFFSHNVILQYAN